MTGTLPHRREPFVLRQYVCIFNSTEKEEGPTRWCSGKESAYHAVDTGQSLGREDALEKEMATHSSILAWKNPWTEEPERLQSMGLQRVRHN